VAAGVWLSEKYVLLAPLASGGMADVLLARAEGDAGFVRTVAVKRTKPMTDRDGLARAADEARMLARIRHPSIATVLDVVEDRSQVHVVMEYVHGASLATLLGAARKSAALVPPEIVSAIIAGVLRGLEAAHTAKSERGLALGIIHRDISPPNVLVGADGVARLVDFGIARAEERAAETATGVMHGKLGYLAPEQLSGEDATTRSDLYACGIVLWECLACEPLFAATDAGAALALRGAGDIRSAVAVREARGASGDDLDAARSLESIAKRALARGPSDRFATAAEMATEIERAVPPATATTVGEWVERIGSAELARRSALLSEVESAPLPPRPPPPPRGSSPPPPPPSPEPPPSPPRRSSRTPLLLFTSFAIVVVAGASALFATRSPPMPPPSPSPSPSSPPPPSPSLSPSPSPPPSLTPAPAPTPAPSPVLTAPQRVAASAKPAPSPSASAAIDCSIPYDLVDGIRRYRPECVGAKPRDGYPRSE
jgi:serine/threonine protein kinase